MDSGASRTMEMAALGRPFSLGMLYDCREDSLVPGMTLWDPKDLEKDTREKPAPHSEFEIVASESIEDKSSSLNVKASLKASFFGGLVEVEGSAKYLNDHKSSKNHARVTLKYKTTTKFQQLSMSHLGIGNMKHAFVFDKGLATHVVTGILYGAQAFFVFDRAVSEKENHQDIEGNLKVMITKIPCLAIEGEGEGSLKMEDKDRENIKKFSCRFHGDFCLEKSPTSFQDAIEVYKSLPKLLGVNGEKAVPVKVWLLPLTSLDSSAAKLVRQISIRLVQESQSVLEDLSELYMRCNDAMRNTTAQQFPAVGEKIINFKEMCNEFKLEFQRTLSQKLPSIRGGGEEEAVLAEILKKRHSSPFNSKHLNDWMNCKEREIRLLKTFTNMMKNTKIVPSQNDLHEETLSAEHAVCFVFTSLGSAEPYLLALSDYLEQTPKSDSPQNSHTHDIEKEQWYHSKNVSETMRNKAKLFRDFAEANKENKTIKFLTVGLTNETQKGSSIYLYNEGFCVNDNFEPPSKPETVTVSDINHNSVSLNISPPRFGAENISYSVEYCVSGEDGWQQKTETKSEVTVRDLSPNTEYMFRCRGVTSVGVGPAVEVSGPIKTLPEDEDLLQNRITMAEAKTASLVPSAQENEYSCADGHHEYTGEVSALPARYEEQKQEQERFNAAVTAAAAERVAAERAAERAAAERAAAERVAAERTTPEHIAAALRAAGTQINASLHADVVRKLLEVPSNWTFKKRKELMEFVRSYETMTEGVEQARILLVGLIGAGKSSFYNSINNIFQGHVTNQARADSDEDSMTTKFRSYTVNDGKGGRPLPFVMCDTMGLEAAPGKGLHLDDITSILKGHIKDGYSFNPLVPLQPGSPMYRENPTLGDKVHCVVYIIDSSNIAQTKAKDRLPEIQRRVNLIDVPQLVIMTKVDETCPHVSKDVKKVYHSPNIQRKMQEMALLLEIPMSCIIPVKNYSHEIELDLNVDILLLTALQQILRFSDGYFQKDAP